ncbi:MAG: SOS response-associated peptidase [Anaerolineae bacterium]|jgi:putative SOS response-associated peptidase YedK|nr:SOS response-associated peptidase [Anaerolineae bacterium]
MCGRFVLTADSGLIQQAFDLGPLAPEVQAMSPRYNIAPSQPVAVITNEDPTELTFHRWGLVPSWAKDLSIGNQMINARLETAAEKPSFKNALKRRRCLIPANGFYEWPKKGQNPIYVHLDGGELFAFAGLWEVWRSPEGDTVKTCTILTTEPNEFIKDYHHRMAVILPRERYAEWLTPGEVSHAEALSFIKMVDADQMRAYEVSKAVNNVGYDSPDCIAPIGTQGTLL